MSDFLYVAKRMLFGQPMAVTAAAVGSKLRSLGRGKDKVQGTAPFASTHPIDLAYGIETSGVLAPGKVRSGSDSDIFSIGYGGAQPSNLRAALNKIPGLDAATFFDIGCGKGRALAVASEFRFRRILGVELSPGLARIAERNASIIAARFPDRTAIEVVQADALKCELPNGFVVAFFYHPGFAPLVRGVANRLADHQTIPGNRILLIYCNPAFGKIFDEHPAYERYDAASYPLGVEDRSNFGETENVIVIWKARTDSLSIPRPGAHARIRATATHAVLET